MKDRAAREVVYFVGAIDLARAVPLGPSRDPVRQPIYDTIWVALDRELNQFVADAKFKGAPDEEQTVEIGYGTYPAFQRRGYMTEIVAGLTAWAFSQSGIERVTAETALDNIASQAVLLNNQFIPFEQNEYVCWWEKKRDRAY